MRIKDDRVSAMSIRGQYDHLISIEAEDIRVFAKNILNMGVLDNNECVNSIILSDDIPPEYVWKGLSEKEIIRQLRHECPELVERCDEDTPLQEVLHRIQDYIENNPNSQVKQIIQQRSYSTKIIGEFSPKTKDIKIYCRAINMSKDEEWIPVLAHELFHAYHYNLIGAIFNDNTNHAEIVREASADYFSYCYCLEKYQYCRIEKWKAAAEELFRKWWQWVVSTSPYAKAWFYLFDSIGWKHFNMNRGKRDKLERVVELSKQDMTDAYHELIPQKYWEDELYLNIHKIKNKLIKGLSESTNSGSKQVGGFSNNTNGWNKQDIYVKEIHYYVKRGTEETEVTIIRNGRIDIQSNRGHVIIPYQFGLFKSAQQIDWDQVIDTYGGQGDYLEVDIYCSNQVYSKKWDLDSYNIPMPVKDFCDLMLYV